MYHVIQNQAWFHHSLEEGGGVSRLILTYSSTNDSDIDVCWLWSQPWFWDGSAPVVNCNGFLDYRSNLFPYWACILVVAICHRQINCNYLMTSLYLKKSTCKLITFIMSSLCFSVDACCVHVQKSDGINELLRLMTSTVDLEVTEGAVDVLGSMSAVGETQNRHIATNILNANRYSLYT